MGDRLAGRPVGLTQRERHEEGRKRLRRARHIAPPPAFPAAELGAANTERGSKGVIAAVRGYLPRGDGLDAEAFRKRHLLLCWVLALHVPSLFAFGVWQGFGVSHSAVEVAVPLACLLFARLAHNRRLAGFFVTAGLVYCSSALVHLSGGTIEAHFHFFILIGLIALYQDWVPFLWNVVFTVLSHGLGSSIAADLMYNHGAAQNRPWSWAVIHGVSVLAACVGVVIFWRNTEVEQQRSRSLAGELAKRELAAVQVEADRRQSVSELFINLARRNQSLLDRQLQLIAELEQNERSPEALGELFKLDHLATRIRRNAESLLVLSGDAPARRWSRPMPLGEVVRAAAAEVEDFRRVKVMVNTHLDVEGRVAADLSHLLAELIENATSFSAPGSEVWVRSHAAFDDQASVVVTIEDTGIGMPEETLQTANELLADPPEIDLRSTQLGLRVVSRLAKRYNLRVRLVPTPGGGTTALVTFPFTLVSERPRAEAVAAGFSPGLARSASPASPAAPAAPPATPGTAIGVAADPGRWPAPGSISPAPSAPSAPPPLTPVDAPMRSGGAVPAPSSPSAPGLWDNGWHLNPPPGSEPAGPGPAVPEPNGGPPVPDGAGPVTADGLQRRVPGAQLPGGLRRSPGGAPASGDASPPTATATEPEAPIQRSDRERVRSMLSRFQAGQRAGRSVAEEAPGSE